MLSQPFEYDSCNAVFKFVMDSQQMVSVFDLNVACETWMTVVDNIRDCLTVGGAHDGIGGAVDRQDGNSDLLPRFAQIN